MKLKEACDAVEWAVASHLLGKADAFCSASIEYNSHGTSYLKEPEDILRYYDSYTWVSDEEKSKALACNSFWAVTWNPDTPVGSCSVVASSLEACFTYARR